MAVTFTYVKKPRVTPLFCDKLILTVDIPSNDQKLVAKALQEAGAHPSATYTYVLRIPLNEKSIPYLSADYSGDTVLRITADPKNPQHNFLRFELNPAKVDLVLLPLHVEHFLPPLMSYASLLDQATVTRFDATVDIQNCPLDSLLVYSQKKQWTEQRSKSGRTIYLGDNGSAVQFCIYDKAAEIKAKNKKKCSDLKDALPKSAITRIEARIKPKMKLKDLVHQRNPFADLVVAAYPPKALATPLAQQTLRLARHVGLDAALKGLPTAEREEVKALLKPFHHAWWAPQKVWAQLPLLLADLAHPEGVVKAS